MEFYEFWKALRIVLSETINSLRNLQKKKQQLWDAPENFIPGLHT